MELRELRSFSTTAKLRSVSKAAEVLGLGQPTVTGHIKRLEEELGMTLFDRVRRPIQLTLAGEKLAQLAAPLIEGIASLAKTTAMAEEVGPVSIASTHDIIPHTLLPIVRRFNSLYPQVHLRIRSGHATEVLQMVAEGNADLGIKPRPERSPDFDFEALFPYERVLITPLGHPLLNEPLTSLDQIVSWPLILMGPRTFTRATLEAEFQRRGLRYDIIMELDSMDAIKRYVALGLGIAVGPRLAIDPEDYEDLGIVRLDTLLPVDQAGIVTLRGKTLSVPAQNFIAVLRDAFAASGQS